MLSCLNGCRGWGLETEGECVPTFFKYYSCVDGKVVRLCSFLSDHKKIKNKHVFPKMLTFGVPQLSRPVKIGGACFRVSALHYRKEKEKMSLEEAEHVSPSPGLFPGVAERDQS